MSQYLLEPVGPAIEIPVQHTEQNDTIQFYTQMFEDDYIYVT